MGQSSLLPHGDRQTWCCSSPPPRPCCATCPGTQPVCRGEIYICSVETSLPILHFPFLHLWLSWCLFCCWLHHHHPLHLFWLQSHMWAHHLHPGRVGGGCSWIW